MSAPYGVVDSGFNPKQLDEELAEIELAEVGAFGAGVVVDSRSPLGQLNGIFSNAVSKLWETSQDIYGSFDPDIATGGRLDSIAKIRRLTRATGQTDDAFRSVMTNADYGKIKTRNLRSDILAVEDVTQVYITKNTSDINLENGLHPHSLAIAVIGGTDADVALAIWNSTTEGIGLYGNTPTQISPVGKCETISFVRPEMVDVSIIINISKLLSGCECSPGSNEEMRIALVTALTGDCGIKNGQPLTRDLIKQAMSKQTGVIVRDVELSLATESPSDQDIAITIDQLANITTDSISINYVDS